MKTRWSFILTLLLLCVVTAVLRTLTPSLHGADHEAFTPPDAGARQAAIGPTENLPVQLRRAFLAVDEFAAIPAPGAFDWLTHHREPGQTYPQFVRSQPNRPDRHRGKIYLLPLGGFKGSDQPDLEQLAEFASRFFKLQVSVQPQVPLDELPIKRRQARGAEQLLTTDVLTWLKTRLPDDAYCLLAVTMSDLYPGEGWNFVFGQASLADRVGVYSFARYAPRLNARTESSQALVLERSCKVLAHETGHMFGMRHCIYFHCLMNGSNHLDESDRQPLHLCPICLRKLHASVEFDLLERYQSLREFAKSADWIDESEWLRARIKGLEIDARADAD